MRATCSLASEKVKLEPSLSVKENLHSLAVSVEQNAKHSLIRDLVSPFSLMELVGFSIVWQLLVRPGAWNLCQLRTTVTQQLSAPQKWTVGHQTVGPTDGQSNEQANFRSWIYRRKKLPP